MANKNSTQVRPGCDHAPLCSLSDADLASRSPLAAKARATTLVPDLHADEAAAYRARLIELYAQSRGDWDIEVHLLDEAASYDRAHPDESPLFDELHAIELFGAQYGEAA